jgi:NAD(P)H-hydrate repair Nnr-like enzyme with NAD(P)H-hydrate dehydratase domain
MFSKPVVDAWCRRLVPPLRFSAHKGSCGRLALVGGAYDGGAFTSLSGDASLRCGVDLVYIMTRAADRPYVHGLSVRPLLEPSELETCIETLHRCDCISIADGTLPPTGCPDEACDPDTVNALTRIVYENAALDHPVVIGAASLTQHSMRVALDTASTRAASAWPILTSADIRTADFLGQLHAHPTVAVGIDRSASTVAILVDGPTSKEVHDLVGALDARTGAAVCRPGMHAVLHGALGTFATWNRLLPPDERLPSSAVAAVAASVVIDALEMAQADVPWPLGVLPSSVIARLGDAVARRSGQAP